jgi:hypothetical protein
MSNSNYDSITSHNDMAEMGKISMQELDAPARPSRVTRNRLISYVSLALAVVGVTLLTASSSGNAMSEPVKKMSSPISSLNAVPLPAGIKLSFILSFNLKCCHKF